MRLLAGGHAALYVVGFGVLSIVCQVTFSYERTVRVLKWLTLGAVRLRRGDPVGVGAVAPGGVEGLTPWRFIPPGTSMNDYASMVVAVLGTTISPYLFFWQASQEVEDNARRPEAAKLRDHPEYAAEHLSRIKQDTLVRHGASPT